MNDFGISLRIICSDVSSIRFLDDRFSTSPTKSSTAKVFTSVRLDQRPMDEADPKSRKD